MILDASTPRSRSATGSGSSARTAPARRRCSGSPPGRDEPDRGRPSSASAACARAARPGGPLRRRVHGRAGPARRRPPRRRPPRADGRRARRLEHDGRAAEPATPTSSTASRSSAATRSTSASTRRCRGSASRATSGHKPPTALSGGEQTRAALARLVIADPDLLLLDEPTNHLDLDALEWLEEHLRRRRGALLVASHDRAFLDATVDRDLGAPRPPADGVPRRLQRLPPPARGARRAAVKDAETPGRADRAREGARPALPKPPQVQQDARARGAARAAPGRADRGAEARRKLRCRARRWPAAARSAPARSWSGSRTWSSATCPAAGRRADGSPAAEPRVVARAPFLAAQRGERIGSSGRTARARRRCSARSRASCRRSTAAVRSATRSSSGYLAQLRGAAIPGATVLDALLEAIPVTPGEARGYLARFLFRGDDAFKEVRALSGGERSRLELALLGIMPSNLLLLDEPTNHLDIPAREAIEAFLAEIAGDAARRVARPAPARDGLRAAVGRRRRARGRRSTAAIARGGRRSRTAGRSRGARARRAGCEPASARRRPAVEWRAGPRRRVRRAAAAASTVGARRAARPRGAKRGEAVEGCLSAPEGGRRRGADPARAAQEPARAGAGRPAVAANFVELRRVTSELADVEPALAPPRTPGWSSRSRRREPARSGSGSPGRSAAASRRSPAGSRELGAVGRSTPTRWRAR